MLRDSKALLMARIAIHRQRGEYGTARRLFAEFKNHELLGDWPPSDDCEPELRSLADLGLSLFACRLLESMGIVYAGQLSRLSKNDLRRIVHLGTWKMIKRIRVALSHAGLDLREPLPDEPPPRRPPFAKRLERRRRRLERRRLRHRASRLSDRRKRQIMELVAKNISQREISRRLGYRSHTTVWAVKREMRARMTNDEARTTTVVQRDTGLGREPSDESNCKMENELLPLWRLNVIMGDGFHLISDRLCPGAPNFASAWQRC